MPHIEAGRRLGDELWDLWPSYFGFTLSFLTIGIMWMNHHGLFKDIERVDHTLLVLNVLLLLGISFVPFPTAVLAEYLRDGDSLRDATLLYGGTFTFTAVVFNALWLYASRHRRLIDNHVSDTRIQQRTWRYVLGPGLYGIGLPLALITPWISLGLYVALAALYLLPLND